MYAGNAAMVCPSAGAADGRVHFVPADLNCQLHRFRESGHTGRLLRCIFGDAGHFVHHDALPTSWHLRDEGAANHLRVCTEYGGSGVHISVQGEDALRNADPRPGYQPARQSLEACQVLARQFGLPAEGALFPQQHPRAIDQGTFHNDLVVLHDRNLVIYHEQAFLGPVALEQAVGEALSALDQPPARFVRVLKGDLTVGDALESFLFNSQLVTAADGSRVLICLERCRQHAQAAALLEKWQGSEGIIDGVRLVSLEESVRNLGGPACLRLRVVLTPEEQASMHPGVILTEVLAKRLETWILKHYRDGMTLDSLKDPDLVSEVRDALDELTTILDVGSICAFEQH